MRRERSVRRVEAIGKNDRARPLAVERIQAVEHRAIYAGARRGLRKHSRARRKEDLRLRAGARSNVPQIPGGETRVSRARNSLRHSPNGLRPLEKKNLVT